MTASVVVPVPARGVGGCFRCHTPVDPHIGATLTALNRMAVTGVGAVLCPGCVDVLAVVAPVPAVDAPEVVHVGNYAGRRIAAVRSMLPLLPARTQRLVEHEASPAYLSARENGSGGVEAAVTAPPPDHPTAGGAM